MRVVDLANHLAGLQMRQQVVYRAQNMIRRLGAQVSTVDVAQVAEMAALVHAESAQAARALTAYPSANDSRLEPQHA